MTRINIDLIFTNHTKNIIDVESIRLQANKFLLKKEFSKNIEIALMLVGSSFIKKLNNKFLKNNKPTDVLSFPTQSKYNLAKFKDKDIPFFLGEIVISYPQAKKQSASKKIPIQDEIEFLFLHGLKHLLGYHHK